MKIEWKLTTAQTIPVSNLTAEEFPSNVPLELYLLHSDANDGIYRKTLCTWCMVKPNSLTEFHQKINMSVNKGLHGVLTMNI